MKPNVIRLKRIYEPASTDDGYRILIDRLWPPGVTRDAAAVDRWARELAPSGELRDLYTPGRFEEFASRYRAELASHREALSALRRRAQAAPLTILFSARDPARSSAAVLAEVLRCPDVAGGTAAIALNSAGERGNGDVTPVALVPVAR